MPTKREIAEALGLNPNLNSRQVYNKATRFCVVGGAQLLDRLEVISVDLQHARLTGNRALVESLEDQSSWLNELKDRFAYALQDGTIPARKLRS